MQNVFKVEEVTLIRRRGGFGCTKPRCRHQIEIKFVRITLLLPTRQAYRSLYFAPEKGAPGKLSPSILAGTLAQFHITYCRHAPLNSICYPPVFSLLCPSLSVSPAFSLTVNASVPSSTFLFFCAVYLFCCKYGLCLAVEDR